MGTAPTPNDDPALHVVRGTPTDEELAALTAALAALAARATAAPVAVEPPSRWARSLRPARPGGGVAVPWRS